MEDMLCYFIFFLVIALGCGGAIPLESAETDLVTRDIENAIELIAGHVHASSTSILEASRSVTDNFEEKLHESFDLANDELVEYSSLLIHRLEKLQHEEAVSIDCVGAHGKALRAVLKNGEKEVEICFQETAKKSRGLFDNVNRELTGVQGSLENVNLVVVDCSKTTDDPISFLGCVTSKGSEIKANVFSLFGQVHDVIASNSISAVDLLLENAKCNEKAYQVTRKQMLLGAEEIEKCFALNDVGPIPGLHHFNSNENDN